MYYHSAAAEAALIVNRNGARDVCSLAFLFAKSLFEINVDVYNRE